MAKFEDFLAAAGIKQIKYDNIPFIKAFPLPDEPKYFDDFLKSFVDHEDFLAFIKKYIPATYHSNEQSINRACFNAEYLIGTLGMKLTTFSRLTLANPDILLQPNSELKDITTVFTDYFYFNLCDITEVINEFPEIYKYSATELLYKVADLCFVFQVTRYTMFDLIHKAPKILLYEIDDIKKYITVVAKIFKCHQDSLRNAIYNYPFILDIPTDYIKILYDKVYAKGFTRLEMRRIFISNAYNFRYSAENILSKVDAIMEKEGMTQKRAVTLIGDCPFTLPLDYPDDYFRFEKALRVSRDFLKTWQYDFHFPHQNFLIKYLFVRCTAIEMRFSKILNTDMHTLFARYFYLKEKLGKNVNFSKDLWLQEHQFDLIHHIKTAELLEKYPLTMKDIDTLFEDYNKLDGKILHWFRIDKPEGYEIPPVYYSLEILKRAHMLPARIVTPQKAAIGSLTLLGFNHTEVEFLLKTVPSIEQKLTIPKLSDIYLAFKAYGFTLEETNWLILHNPALLEYHATALQNRLRMISMHYPTRLYCIAWPDRI